MRWRRRWHARQRQTQRDHRRFYDFRNVVVTFGGVPIVGFFDTPLLSPASDGAWTELKGDELRAALIAECDRRLGC